MFRSHTLASASRARCLALLLAGCLLAQARPGTAAGLFLPGHGVRGMGRAGAFTAGADDPGGIWYNPASLGALGRTQLLADGALIFYELQYRRVDSGGNSLPAVSNEAPPAIIPDIAAGGATPWIRGLWWGVAVSAPYAPIQRFPRPSFAPCDPSAPRACLDTAPLDAPQRYSSISLEGTTFLQLEAAVAYQLAPGLVVGVSLQNMFAYFVSLSVVSSYNGTLSSGPEDPEYDSLSQLKMRDLFNPSGKLGLTYQPHPLLRLGLALQLPCWIASEGQVNVQLPVSVLFERASVVGDRARFALLLPLTLRFGAELQPLPGLRVELGLDYEGWSVLEQIQVEPLDIYILDLPGIDRYQVPQLAIPLNFHDTFTVRLGGEYTLGQLPLVVRAGYLFERGAVDQAYLSVLAVDSDKHLVSVGLGYSWGRLRCDLLLARSFAATRQVGYRQSRSLQINPINPSGAVAVGGGSYQTSYTVAGLGLRLEL